MVLGPDKKLNAFYFILMFLLALRVLLQVEVHANTSSSRHNLA